MEEQDEEGTVMLRDTEHLSGPPRRRTYQLTVTEPGQQAQSESFDLSVLRVGTLESNDLTLKDESVSRIHFEIIAEQDGFRVKDLGSTNGTFVDGIRVFDAYLRARTRIEVGKTKLNFLVLDDESEEPLHSDNGFGPLVGRSMPMRALFAKVERAAATNSTVLVQGESGTGKELIAEALHRTSPRRGGPFVVFDCSAVPPNLVESELFGHEKGAFTGADSARTGCFAEANGGTLFLDEIGELPLQLQPKLLRVLESRRVRPVGGNKSTPVEIRVVAATNRDLAEEVNSGAFRADLYYRMAVVQLRVPPLRERISDIPLLVEHLLQRLYPDATSNAALSSLTPEDWADLQARTWRGNVRELRNTLERAVAMKRPGEKLNLSGELSEPDLQPTVPDRDLLQLEVQLGRPYLDEKRRMLAEFERRFLQHALDRCEGNYSRAANETGLDRSYFKRILRKHQT